jgi:hypothetical protein
MHVGMQSLARDRDINRSRFVSFRLCCLAWDGTNVITVRVIKSPGYLPDARVQVRVRGISRAPGASYQRSVPMQSIRPTYGAAPWEFDERATTKLLKIMYDARRLPPAEKSSTYRHIGDTFPIFDLVGHTLTRESFTKFWL